MNQFISFPKSGRTWVRYCLLQYGITDNNIKFHHDNFEYSSKKDPAINFDIVARISKYKNIPTVFMKRNFHDTYLSFYHQIIFRFKDVFNLNLTLDELSVHPYFGYKNLLSFHHMQSEVMKKLTHIKIIDYQECQEDMFSTMLSILDFYQFDIDKTKLMKAVNNSQFNEMRKVEVENNFSDDWLLPRNNSYKTRKGIVGSFYKETNEQTRHYFNDSLLTHDIADKYQFVCLLNGSSSLKQNTLGKEIEFILNRYNKKTIFINEHILIERFPFSNFVNKNIQEKIKTILELSMDFFSKGYNVIISYDCLEEQMIFLKNYFNHQFIVVEIMRELIEDNKQMNYQFNKSVTCDLKIDIINFNAEQLVSKLLSEIYYHLLYH